jgi:hypothetical protein
MRMGMEVVPRKSGRFAMDIKTHWEKVYKTKAPDTVSWYLPHLETSLSLIERTGTGLFSSIIEFLRG